MFWPVFLRWMDQLEWILVWWYTIISGSFLTHIEKMWVYVMISVRPSVCPNVSANLTCVSSLLWPCLRVYCKIIAACAIRRQQFYHASNLVEVIGTSRQSRHRTMARYFSLGANPPWAQHPPQRWARNPADGRTDLRSTRHTTITTDGVIKTKKAGVPFQTIADTFFVTSVTGRLSSLLLETDQTDFSA